jgi:hypothetical protein
LSGTNSPDQARIVVDVYLANWGPWHCTAVKLKVHRAKKDATQYITCGCGAA